MQILTSTDGKERFIYLVELYRQLKVKEPYTNWIKRVLNADMENVSFWREYVNNNPVPETEFLSVEAARQISLNENTERGLAIYRQLRQVEPNSNLHFVAGGLLNQKHKQNAGKPIK